MEVCLKENYFGVWWSEGGGGGSLVNRLRRLLRCKSVEMEKRDFGLLFWGGVFYSIYPSIDPFILVLVLHLSYFYFIVYNLVIYLSSSQ